MKAIFVFAPNIVIRRQYVRKVFRFCRYPELILAFLYNIFAFHS